jgi:Shwachman-Bodian-Diamond syndrome (SBDS) protein
VAKWGVRISTSVILAQAHPHAKPAHRIREKDLDDVLQISNVFMNVSKGEVAKSNDLKKSFGTDDRNTIAREVSSISPYLTLHLTKA